MSTSLVVLQFMALVSGEWSVQRPANKARTESIITQHGMCLGCCAMTDHDVIHFEDGNELSMCRACGHKLLNGVEVRSDGVENL
jgi:hypothetical protein